MANGRPAQSVLADLLRNSAGGHLAPTVDMIRSWMDSDDVDAADDWLDSLYLVEQMFPDTLVRDADCHRRTFQIEKVYSNGEIQGVCDTDLGQFAVFARADGSSPPAGCSCAMSAGQYPCEHSLGFVQSLTAEIERRTSLLRKRIQRSEFDQGRPNRNRFDVQPSQQVLDQLDRLIERQSLLDNSDVSDGENALPAVKTFTETRIVWDFTHEHEDLSVRPILQQRKKRGNGFTKGRNLSLEKVRSDLSLSLSLADREVVGLIQSGKGPYYYSRHEYDLEPFDALNALVGQPNITLDSEPYQVKRRPLVLSLHYEPNNGGWLFCICDEHGKTNIGKMIGSSNAAVAIDRDDHTMYLSNPAGETIQFARHLMSLAIIEDEHIEQVIEKIRPFQKQMTLRLPQSHAGPIVVEQAALAMLLRSRTDGSLDYGIRVRDATGVLRRPGADPMIVGVERDGKPVQVQRLAEDEYRCAENVIKTLGIAIDRDQWFGTISDFRHGLALIEKLQSGDLDIEILWDKTSEKPVTVLGNLTSKNVRVEITSKRNWFGISGECDFGNHKMPLKDLLDELSVSGDAAVQGEYVRLGDGQWARISEQLRKRLKKLRDATHADRSTLKIDATSAPAIRDLMDSDVEVNAAKSWQKCLDRLACAERLVPKLPEGLQATLRDYQVDGYKWMRRLAEWGVGGILADDMGLGKTLQTLAVLLDRSQAGPALVIAPTSVGFNWLREAERFTPNLNVHLYRETERGDFLPSVGPGDLVVCSYGLALRDADALSSVHWGTIVLDEAQAIKNSRSKTSKAIANLNAQWTIALTGTPVENHLGELWSLFHVVSPGVFGGWDQFRKRFAAPIEKQGDQDSRLSLAARLQPFVLRRTKNEVLKELPPRTDMNLYVDLSPAERAEYEKVRLVALGEIEQIESLPNIQDQRFKILALLTRLRQISCHAGLVNKNWTESSAKLDQLCETLESLKEEGHRALVFSQFTQHLSLIRQALQAKGFSYEYLDGSTPAKARQEAVDRFQDGTADAFLISLKAGGTGLNLTAADYVIHMDPWWNPAVEDQATDRAHRIGQDKPVMVYRIIARGTIEEEILALHESKRDLVAGVMQGTEAAGKLSNDDLIRMLRQ